MRVMIIVLKKDDPKEPETPRGYNSELLEENQRHSPACAMVKFKPPDKPVLYSPKDDMLRGMNSDMGRRRRHLDSVPMLTWIKSLLDRVLQDLLHGSNSDAVKIGKVERHTEEENTANKQE